MEAKVLILVGVVILAIGIATHLRRTYSKDFKAVWHLEDKSQKEVVFYMHRDGYLPTDVTVKSSQPIKNFPEMAIQRDIPRRDKVWFTDIHGKPLDCREEYDDAIGRIFWVTVRF